MCEWLTNWIVKRYINAIDYCCYCPSIPLSIHPFINAIDGLNWDYKWQCSAWIFDMKNTFLFLHGCSLEFWLMFFLRQSGVSYLAWQRELLLCRSGPPPYLRSLQVGPDVGGLSGDSEEKLRGRDCWAMSDPFVLFQQAFPCFTVGEHPLVQHWRLCEARAARWCLARVGSKMNQNGEMQRSSWKHWGHVSMETSFTNHKNFCLEKQEF